MEVPAVVEYRTCLPEAVHIVDAHAGGDIDGQRDREYQRDY
jgi:hypothetical protein